MRFTAGFTVPTVRLIWSFFCIRVDSLLLSDTRRLRGWFEAAQTTRLPEGGLRIRYFDLILDRAASAALLEAGPPEGLEKIRRPLPRN